MSYLDSILATLFEVLQYFYKNIDVCDLLHEGLSSVNMTLHFSNGTSKVRIRTFSKPNHISLNSHSHSLNTIIQPP